MIHFIFRSIWRDQAANERFAKAMWEEHREGMEKKEKEEEERLFREFLEEYKRVAGLLKGIEYEHEE